ncbi:hypothetical protein GCM10009688_32890 [Arthrobacter gandavensis]|uniref:Uncharacterized protein n=1 Tax=Arthrobacter gandavensis TaxID=169960 RepID=A0ABN2PQ53_9MICC
MRRKNQKQQILLPQDPTVCQTITPGPTPQASFPTPKEAYSQTRRNPDKPVY